MKMPSRKYQAAMACALFVLAASVYEILSGKPVDQLRVLIWSTIGVALYVFLSRLAGFDPHRSKLPHSASRLLQYVERYELRCGIATLAMTLTVVLLAKWVDADYCITAVVSATLAAWLYFVLRIFQGGYEGATARN
jgi:hypothetical protein